MLSNEEKVAEHIRWLQLYDSCNEATISASEPIGELKTPAKASLKMIKTFEAFTDSVSKSYKKSYMCGNYTYAIVDKFYEPAPSFVTIDYIEGQEDFAMTLDSRTLDEPF